MQVDNARIDLTAAHAYLRDAMDAIRVRNIKLTIYLCGRVIREIASAITNLTDDDT